MEFFLNLERIFQEQSLMACVLYVLYGLFSLYESFMMIYIIMSWIPPLYKTKVFRFFQQGTYLFLKPFRGLIVLGPIDFTPLIGFFVYGLCIQCYIYIINLILI